VGDQPLEPDDERYVDLYEQRDVVGEDPVKLLADAIEFTHVQSVQLFSGFRGTGKSTQLRRLRRRLREGGYLVLLIDIEDYLNTSTSVDISDFLIALAGAAADALRADELLGASGFEDFWERIKGFITRTRIDATFGLDVALAGASMKLALRQDPDFRDRIRKAMAGHLGALVRDVHEYFQSAVLRLKERHGDDREVVIIVDSIEHIRGKKEVQDSVETLFAVHHDKLHLPFVHVIYTVHPYLKVRYPNLSALYEPGGVWLLPMIKVRDRSGAPYGPGITALREVIAGRGDWSRLLGTDYTVIDRLIALSGGYLRDLFGFLKYIILQASALPAPADVVDKAIQHRRSENLPIADDDALWLDAIRETHSAALPSEEHLARFAHFLETGRVFCYRNGDEWYDVHPLIAEHIQAQAEALRRAKEHA
jgi:hypothetical protein